MKSTVFSVTRLTRLALFIALMVVLNFTPLGLIRLGVINLTLLFLPVIAGTLFMGLQEGLILGFCFGAISAWSAFTAPSGLAALVVSISPFWAIVMCFVPRLLIPLNVHFAERLLTARGRRPRLSLPVASVVGTLTNTVFYLGTMYLIFVAAGFNVQSVLSDVLAGKMADTGLALGALALLIFVVGPLGETAISGIVVPPVVYALRRLDNKSRG